MPRLKANSKVYMVGRRALELWTQTQNWKKVVGALAAEGYYGKQGKRYTAKTIRWYISLYERRSHEKNLPDEAEISGNGILCAVCERRVRDLLSDLRGKTTRLETLLTSSFEEEK